MTSRCTASDPGWYDRQQPSSTPAAIGINRVMEVSAFTGCYPSFPHAGVKKGRVSEGLVLGNDRNSESMPQRQLCTWEHASAFDARPYPVSMPTPSMRVVYASHEASPHRRRLHLAPRGQYGDQRYRQAHRSPVDGSRQGSDGVHIPETTSIRLASSAAPGFEGSAKSNSSTTVRDGNLLPTAGSTSDVPLK